LKPTISLAENKYAAEEVAAADFAIKSKDLEEYAKDVEDRTTRISKIKKLYAGADFNAPIYELAFKKLLENKNNYKKDFVVPFGNPMEQDLVLTPNEKVKLVSFSHVDHIYNTKELKGEKIFFDYGPSTGKVASLYISKDGNFGFLIRFNRYQYRSSNEPSDSNSLINDGEFKGEAYESTLVNLIMFFSAIIKNQETNILASIEQIVVNNPASTLANVYLKTKENLSKVENIDKEFSEVLDNTAFAKRSKIEYIESIGTTFVNEVLPLQFFDTEEKNAYRQYKHPIFDYKLVAEEGSEVQNFFLHYVDTYRSTYTEEGLLLPTLVRIKKEKLYLLYAINLDGTIPTASGPWASSNCEVADTTIKVAGKEYLLVESKKYFPLLKQTLLNNISTGVAKEGNTNYYLQKFEIYGKNISLGFIKKLKSSKRKLSLIESKLVPYEYKLKIINVLSEILIKAFTNEIFIKKI
jgi:hypothetical protein